MSILATELESLYQKVLDAVNIIDIKKPEQRKKLDDICLSIPYFVSLVHMPSILPVYLCPKALDYLGMPGFDMKQMSMSFYTKVLHPDNAPILQLGAAHFYHKPDELFPFTCKTAIPSRGWRWIYGYSRLLRKAETGGALYIIAILCDMQDVFEKQLATVKDEHLKILNADEMRLYMLLTTREREILGYIQEEASSEEIAKRLYLSEHTVRAHRKSLLKKLKVKSSVGLVKFAMYRTLVGNRL
ncbi:hypothetical protein BH09BAC1_BH09BAC1_04740 [soil metagenome]